MTDDHPIVLVHGAWHGPWCWTTVADDLRARGRVVHAITLPFHDQPGDHSRIWPLARSYVAKVARIVAELDRPPVLVGHSMGGYVVQRYLEQVSGSVAGAVLLASVPRRGVLPVTLALLRTRPAVTLRAMATLDLWPVVAGDDAPARLFLGPDAPAASADLLRANLQNESYPAYVAMVLRRVNPARITAPTLVLAAELDALFPVDSQRDLAHALGAELEVVPGAGHDLMLDTSAPLVADRIAAWPPPTT